MTGNGPRWKLVVALAVFALDDAWARASRGNMNAGSSCDESAGEGQGEGKGAEMGLGGDG